MYYASNAYISAKAGTSALMKAYLWSTSGGKANLSKVRNQKVAKLQIVFNPILILVKKLIP